MWRGFLRFLQYLYFLRFSVLLWFILPAAGWLVGRNNLAHAIFTPEWMGQYIGATFFAVCCGWIALLMARLVANNGSARFSSPMKEPVWMNNWLGPQSDSKAGWVLILAQAPTVCLLCELHHYAAKDQVGLARCGQDVVWMGVGVAVAVFFWTVVGFFYYWTFPFDKFRRSARTLLFPRWWFALGGEIIPPLPADFVLPDTIECRGKIPRLLNLVESIFKGIAAPGAGYRDAGGGPLWEAHRLLALAASGYFGLYFFLFPLTAPVKRPISEWIALTSGVIVFVALAAAVILIRMPRQAVRTRRVQWVAFALLLAVPVLVGILCFRCVKLPFLYFPVLGSLAVLVTFLCLALGALAFLLDRYSFPVLTTILACLVLMHALWSRHDDHYFRAQPLSSDAKPLTPAQVLQARCNDPNRVCTLIAVTSTGGGMHAAVWSSSVLVALEKAFDKERMTTKGMPRFHESLFFASTVSGGSFGMAPFLREYTAGKDAFALRKDTNEKPDEYGKRKKVLNYERRIQEATSCSALEAVAWGLEYGDFMHFVFPVYPPGAKDDRSNALEEASGRNYSSTKCGQLTTDEGGLAKLDDLTLGRLQPGPNFPAFAFNTTEVETGGRFLLANYANLDPINTFPKPLKDLTGVFPAQSFLQLYGLDMQLLTAARLSGTYPYISSAARIESKYEDPGKAPHYIDGGYYDNDGTATLVEFLALALLDERQKAKASPGTPPKYHILVIQIRDSGELNSENSSEELCAFSSEGCGQWGIGTQIAAPPLGFWRAGHGSVSYRDQRELTILKNALEGVATIEPITIAYSGDEPLSWHLTPAELTDIRNKMHDPKIQGELNLARDWAAGR
jgi:hypothetical protein